MKEKLTLRNLLVVCAAVLAVVVMAIVTTAGITEDGLSITGLVAGKWTMALDGQKETMDASFHCTLSLVGYILVLVGGVGACAVALLVKNEKVSKWAVVGAAALILVGAVLVLLLKTSYVHEDVAYLIRIGVLEPSEKQEGIKELTEQMKSANLSAGSVVAGVMAILAAGSACASRFVPDVKLVK